MFALKWKVLGHYYSYFKDTFRLRTLMLIKRLTKKIQSPSLACIFSYKVPSSKNKFTSGSVIVEDT